jgi:hypothetical protein
MLVFRSKRPWQELPTVKTASQTDKAQTLENNALLLFYFRTSARHNNGILTIIFNYQPLRPSSSSTSVSSSACFDFGVGFLAVFAPATVGVTMLPAPLFRI